MASSYKWKYNLPYNHNMIIFFIEFGIIWIWKWDFIINTKASVDILTLQRVFWVRWWIFFSKRDIVSLFEQINQKVNEYFSKYQTRHQEVTSFLNTSSLNPFDMLKSQIKFDYANISEMELMKKFMQSFKDQVTQSFTTDKEDSSMGFVKDSKEGILVGEGQNSKEDIASEEYVYIYIYTYIFVFFSLFMS